MRLGEAETADRVVLVAEIGNNHEGSTSLAEEMIGQAWEAGADAIKLQTLVPELLVSSLDTDRLEQLRRLVLSHADTVRLIRGAMEQGIYVFSTPLDLSSLAAVTPVVRTVKIASGDITFTTLLEGAASTGHDVVLSTGASTLQEVSAAVATLESVWVGMSTRPDLAILHCVSNYPAATASVNLRAMATLASAFPNSTIGYSDHTLGIETAVLAAAAGARIVEKHFTLDKKTSDFRDHALSATPTEFRELRTRLDFVQEVLGNDAKRPDTSEEQVVPLIRRSLTVVSDLAVGSRIKRSDLACLRPGLGLPPSAMEQTLGRSLAVAKRAGEVLRESDLS